MSGGSNTGGRFGTKEQVKIMYEKFPYPASTTDGGLISDLANLVGFTFPDDDFEGKTIMDFGCGSGHRLVRLAQAYPESNVIGVDMTEASLSVARQLSQKYKTDNLSFIQSDLVTFRSEQKADLITSTGVLHHLEKPQAGFDSVSANLKEDGVAAIWLYHQVGEFFRLLECELARILSKADAGEYDDGLKVLHELKLGLSKKQYGAETAHQKSGEVDDVSVNVDAFLHPIVNAYRFEETMQMCKNSGMSWTMITGVNRQGESWLLDPAGVSKNSKFVLQNSAIFDSELLIERFSALPILEKIKAIEIAWRPTGFTCLTGKNDSFKKCEPRVVAGVI